MAEDDGARTQKRHMHRRGRPRRCRRGPRPCPWRPRECLPCQAPSAQQIAEMTTISTATMKPRPCRAAMGVGGRHHRSLTTLDDDQSATGEPATVTPSAASRSWKPCSPVRMRPGPAAHLRPPGWNTTRWTAPPTRRSTDTGPAEPFRAADLAGQGIEDGFGDRLIAA